jgi:SPP1 gp7 family putative phage head morphogenesis protein
MPLELLTHLFGKEDSLLIQRLAKKVNAIEAQWKRKFEKHIDELTDKILNEAEKTGRLNFKTVDFEDLIMRHRLDVVRQATEQAKKTPAKSALSTKRLGILETIRKQYDAYRKKGKIPKREQSIAENLKKQYIGKLKEAYKKYGEEFRSGKVYDQEEARIKIQKAAGVAYGRAKTIVNTETTRYYNEARKDFYDDAEGVTHYLFMAIRDSRTTKWCRTRHGIVYEKNSDYLKKETPPCHWNCRSEILPLTISNPRHKKMIEDKSLRRSRRRPAELPEGWNE